MTPAVATSLLLLSLLLSSSAMLSMPIGMVTAMFSLTYNTPLSEAAVLAAGGVTLGRIAMALAARRSGAGRSPNDGMIGAMLSGRSEYRRLTFSAGFLPFVPARFLFPLLGRMKAPIRWAAFGTLCGQFLVVLLTSWVARGIGRAMTSNDHDAGRLIGILAITWVAYALVTNIDWDAWRASNTLRFKSAKQRGPFGGLLDGADVEGGRFPGFDTNPFGFPGSGPQTDDDDSVIEAEVVRESHVGDDDSPSGPVSLPPGS